MQFRTPRSRLSLSALAVPLGLLLAASACDSEPDRSKKVPLPSPVTSTAQPAPSVSRTPQIPVLTGESAKVLAAYLNYLKVIEKSQALPFDKVEAFLAAYVTDPFLTEEVAYARLTSKAGKKVTGAYVPGAPKVEVTGTKAFSVAYVTDCQDASGVVVTNVKTGAEFSRGSKKRGVRMAFVLLPDKPAKWYALNLKTNKKWC